MMENPHGHSSSARFREISKSNRLCEIPIDTNMLQTLAIILIVAWLLGMVSSYTMGGVIHILLVIAIILILVRLIQGKRIT